MTYDWFARLLHWLMALLLIIMFFFGLGLEDLPLEERREDLPQHASMGVILFLLAVVRLVWRRRHPAPPYPDSMSARQQKWAKGVVHAFYIFMLVIPVAGFLHAATYVDFDVYWFGVVNVTAVLPSGPELTKVFHVIHGTCAWLLAILVIGHIGATLKHAFIDKDVIPSRMIPFVKAPK